jgi:hypothetical protein
MTNMTNKQVFLGGLTGLAAILLCTVSSSYVAAQEANAAVYAAMKGNPKLRLVQTNFAGDVVSIIDPATNKVVEAFVLLLNACRSRYCLFADIRSSIDG